MRAVVLAVFVLLVPQLAAATMPATLYKDPWCECCAAYADYLRGHGFDVTVIETEAMDARHAEAGTPAGFEGCHLTMIEGYAIEGHVPVGAIRTLLDEHPALAGISLPGMPEGSPGMTGVKQAPFVVYGFGGAGEPEPYVTE